MVGRIAVSAEYELVYDKWLEVEGSGGPNFPLRPNLRETRQWMCKDDLARRRFKEKDFDFF